MLTMYVSNIDDGDFVFQRLVVWLTRRVVGWTTNGCQTCSSTSTRVPEKEMEAAREGRNEAGVCVGGVADSELEQDLELYYLQNIE